MSTKRKLNIAMFSTARVSVPPPKYGGVELIVYNLAEALTRRGHRVTVFATGDSKVSGKLEFIHKTSGYKKQMLEGFLNPLSHTAYSFKKIKEGSFDIIHNHYHVWGIAFGGLLEIPVITTYHGNFKYDLEHKFESKDDLKKIFSDTPFVSISKSQAKLQPFKINWIKNIYNGIEVEKFEFNAKPKDYFVWLGRFAPEKGAIEAIQACKDAGEKLILAGRLSTFRKTEMDYYKKVKPLIDDKQIKYIGEVGHKKKVQLLKNAKGLLNTIQWDEPFGLVMTEAFACGTPVIANKFGAVPEIVTKETGFITRTQKDIVQAIKKVDTIDRKACRARVEKYFSTSRMVDQYEEVYFTLL